MGSRQFAEAKLYPLLQPDLPDQYPIISAGGGGGGGGNQGHWRAEMSWQGQWEILDIWRLLGKTTRGGVL